MKITFGALVTDGKGKLGGHAAQGGAAGAILRTIAQPKKTPTQAQSIRRQFVQVLSQSWRNLTESQRKTWNDNARPKQSGFDLYMSTNLLLLSNNLPLLPEYINPGPTNYITTPIQYSITGDWGPPIDIIYINFGNLFNSFIPSDWIPVIKWTGWKAPSINNLGTTSLNIKRSAISSFNNTIFIEFGNADSAEVLPPSEGYKAKFNLSFINNATGATFNQLDIILTATETPLTPLAYDPLSSIGDYSITPVSGGFDYALDIYSGNSSFNFNEWEPWFWMSNWQDDSIYTFPAASQYINPLWVEFVDSENIILHLNHSDGNILAPPNTNSAAYIMIGWKQKGGSLTETEIGGILYSSV